MRVAVLSDVHGNLHALERVLAEIEREQPDEVWSLGDVVGYGPRPNECCDAVSGRADVSLAGNHDLGVLGSIDLEDFSEDAAESARWTREHLSAAARSYLEPLEPTAVRDGAELFHASPRDPVWDYILTGEAVVAALELTTAPLVLVGHSHVPIAILESAGSLDGGVAEDGHEVDLGRGRWLLNPGSVGQPRDGDPRAAFLLLDLGRGQATFRRIDYQVEATQAEIREAGLPDALAERLARGV